jgi:hypothetical protein
VVLPGGRDHLRGAGGGAVHQDGERKVRPALGPARPEDLPLAALGRGRDLAGIEEKVGQPGAFLHQAPRIASQIDHQPAQALGGECVDLPSQLVGRAAIDRRDRQVADPVAQHQPGPHRRLADG